MLLALDTETTGLTWDDEAFLMSYASIGTAKAIEIDRAIYVLKVCAMGTRPEDRYIFHNAKFDLRMLIKAGVLNREEITYKSFHDTQIMAQLIDENRSLKLKELAKSVLGLETDEADAIRKAKKELKLKAKDGYHLLPREIVIPYAIKDAEFTLALYHAFEQEEFSRELYDRERKLVLAVLDMEANGMGVDLEYAEAKRKELNGSILHREHMLKIVTADPDFNPGSPKQIAEYIAAMGITLPVTEKGNPKTSTDVLSKCGGGEFVRLILEQRKETKLLNTYIKPLLEEGKSGVLHPNFNVAATVTGRFSSSQARE